MGGHLSGSGAGAALALTAAAASMAAGAPLAGGGVPLLLLSVLVASRWHGHIAGYAATLTAAALSVAWLAASGAGATNDGADAVALGLLGLIGTCIAAWTRPRVSRSSPPALDPRRVKEEFLATVSHELRTPLNAILGWTELLRMPRAVGPQQVDRGLEVIERNARRQLALVEELLAAADPEISTHERRPFDIRDVLDGVIDGLEPEAAGGRVALVVDEPDAAGAAVEGAWVHGDAARLQLALRHVLENAIKYTPPGGEVRIRMRQCGGQVLIFVSDTGRGIEAARLDQIFEPFNQVDGSPRRHFGGLGLGLTIARRLVERHGGHIDLRSDDAAGGATVLITLPVANQLDVSETP
jgi:signal transduction histidine kinase